ncbi:MAG TPA: hypothetical protein VI756_03245, partial [Blastocatellia bacterium]
GELEVHFDRLAAGIFAGREANLPVDPAESPDEHHRRKYTSLRRWLDAATQDIGVIKSELANARSQNDSLAEQSIRANRNLCELSGRIEEQEQTVGALQAQMDNAVDELGKIKATRAWKWASRYGRFKHGYLLPLYRRMGFKVQP